MKIKELTFEDAYPVIKSEIEKKKHKWTLTSLAWISYEDVSQIILLHISYLDSIIIQWKY